MENPHWPPADSNFDSEEYKKALNGLMDAFLLLEEAVTAITIKLQEVKRIAEELEVPNVSKHNIRKN